MDTHPKHILDIALTLPESDRAGLAASLIRSLDDAPDSDADAQWVTEIERASVPLTKVLPNLRNGIR
jgi:hypothetical protein